MGNLSVGLPRHPWAYSFSGFTMKAKKSGGKKMKPRKSALAISNGDFFAI